jgi:glyoxylase-like metal-dependent hydrolase (beta-lactamase superfamily II)
LTAAESTLFGRPARFAGGLHEVAPGTFAWLQPNGELGESNAGLVVGDGEALLIDTLWDLRLTRRMLNAIAARIDVPIRTLVNTHSDPDHTWGNQLIGGAEIVATEAAARLIREEGPEPLRRMQSLAGPMRTLGSLPLPVVGTLPAPLLPRLRLRELGAYLGTGLAPFDWSDVSVTPPTREFSGELELDAGGRLVRLIEVGPAHTPGDLLVHVPDVRVCFAGDILFVGVTPIMWAGPIGNWIDALNQVLGLDVEVVVGGHGPVAERSEVQALLGYLGWVQRTGERELEAGSSPSEAARSMLGSPEYRASSWSNWDSPERLVVTLAVMDRHRRGESGAIGTRERIRLFAQMATLARELESG